MPAHNKTNRLLFIKIKGTSAFTGIRFVFSHTGGMIIVYMLNIKPGISFK